MLIKDRNCDCTIGLTFPVNIPRDKSHEGRGVLCSAVTVSRCNKMDVFSTLLKRFNCVVHVASNEIKKYKQYLQVRL